MRSSAFLNRGLTGGSGVVCPGAVISLSALGPDSRTSSLKSVVVCGAHHHHLGFFSGWDREEGSSFGSPENPQVSNDAGRGFRNICSTSAAHQDRLA